MSWNKNIDVLTKALIDNAKNWEVLDWENFRRDFYENYFLEKDSINSKEALLEFRKDKLSKMKQYNLKYS